MAGLLPVLLCSCAGPREPVSRVAFAFDTVITVTLYDQITDGEADDILNGAVRLAEDLDHRLFSAHDIQAEVWKICHADGKSVPVSPQTRDLLLTSLYWAGLTENAFLPTMGALSGLWNFTGDPPGPVPDPAAIRRLLAHTSPRSVHLESPEDILIPQDSLQTSDPADTGAEAPAAFVRVDDPDLIIDLGGIAKGYAADLIKAYLRERGIRSAVINLGGNVLLVGSHPDGSDFQVGIRDPEADKQDADGQTILTLKASDISIVTSGIYERCFEENGIRYHHILDPATGYPADSGLVSVTVISPDSASGDALATALLVMGAEKGQALIERLPDTEALFITTDGSFLRTSGFPQVPESSLPGSY